MNTLNVLWLAWPWIGFGGGIVIAIQLFFTNHFRSTLDRPRYSDATWLSWLMVLAYLIHVCEEYALHITDGQFYLIDTFVSMGVSERFGNIPLWFFPYINIVMTWIALPIAAVLSKKNPVIGLSGIGFVLINGLTHLGSCVAGHATPIASPGSVTGIFVFLPLFGYVVYICKKDKLLPRKGLGIAIASGVIAHILLFTMYLMNKVAGHMVAAIYIPIVCFSPLIISGLLCKKNKK